MKKTLNGCLVIAVLLSVNGGAGAADAAGSKTKAAKQASAERSAIRVLCEGKNADAVVSVNGALKGECPLDLEVAPGAIQVRAVKKRDEFYESVFEQNFTLGSGVAKRIEVVFNQRPQFRADAMARVDKEVDASQSALELKRRGELPSLEASAANGDAAAMTRLGLFYKNGLAGPVDRKKSVDWYKKGAAAGDADAMYEYALLLEQGKRVDKNMAMAIELYQKSAASGQPAALNRMGRFLERGSDGFQQDRKLAGAYYKKAAEGGNNLSSLMYWSTLPEAEQDAGLAVEEKLATAAARIQMQKAEIGEDTDALLDAGGKYTYGVNGYEKNPARALTYYRIAVRQKRKAVASGDAESIYEFGYWNEKGVGGIPTDRAAAMRYYKQAQQLGSTNAAEALAKLQSE